MNLRIMKNKNNLVLVLGVFLLIAALSIILLFVTENNNYGRTLIKVFNVLVLAASLIYTYYLYNKQILINAMFGITRKETHKKWFIKLIIVGMGTLFVNMLYAFLEYYLFSSQREFIGALVWGLSFLEGFYGFYLFNFLMFLFTSLNIKKKIKKSFALLIFIISLIISLLASLILTIPVIFPDKVYLAIYLTTLDLYIGLVVFVLGLLLIIFIKKVLHKGAL